MVFGIAFSVAPIGEQPDNFEAIRRAAAYQDCHRHLVTTVLDRLAGQGRVLIRQKVSQSDLAAMAGIARENVSRVLNDWTNRSLVSRLAGYYCLENKAALNREAGGSHSWCRRFMG